ncbi:MAG: hypothetical protein WCU88_05515 [Elusimicrobiota bacterium]|jgi:hypothetical protein
MQADRNDALKTAAKSWSFAKTLAMNPRRALEETLSSQEALWTSARLYLVYLASAILFYGLIKPADFPATGEIGLPEPSQGGLAFWAQVQVWNPLLTALSIMLTAFFARLLAKGRLALRLPAACAFAAIPLILLVCYRNGDIPRWGLGLGLSALGLLLWLDLRRMQAGLWRPLTAWLLAINILNVAALPLFCLAVWTRMDGLYLGIEILLLFILLGWACFGVSRIAAVPTARAFCAVFLSVLGQILFIFALYVLGWLPKSVLMALMSV